ncbi:unannotated protein [freshwater metagenome]|uniref:Unannotated protein n=1 Tax=freshwater metagenome TaxID=449393 RepID=A0A6J7H1S0_9ZZZZ
MTQRSPTSGPARDSGEPRSLTAPVNGTEPASHRGGRATGPVQDRTDRAPAVRRRAEEVLAEILAFEELVDDGLVPDADGLERLTTCAVDLHLDVQALAAGPAPTAVDDVLGASDVLRRAVEASTRILEKHLGC